MCQTNPIWPGWPGRDAGGRESPPGHGGAKQSQFPPRRQEGQRLGGKGVMVNSTFDRLRQNKANLPQRPPRGAGRRIHQPSRRCGVLCQTNPIPRLWIADHVIASEARQSGLRIQKGLGPAARTCGAGCTNKPNLHPPGGIGRASRNPKRGSSPLGARSTLHVAQWRQTKPICGGRWSGAGGRLYKQSQF
jgi:hypothetical protein